MDEDLKALAREAVGLYKRHVEVLERQQRIISSWWQFPLRVWAPLIAIGVVGWLILHWFGAL
jgi:hypothetical protein